MIVDSSAVAAVMFRESGYRALAELLLTSVDVSMSAANLLEAAIVIERRGGLTASRQLDLLLAEVWQVQIEPVTVAQVRIARTAYRDFGKGTDHPAQLNFGDCFAYALAAERDEPLLFVGDDFGHTDVRVAKSSLR